VGDSTVSSANGIELAAGECISIEGEELRGNFLEVDLADIYVDTETNGNVVRVAYMARR